MSGRNHSFATTRLLSAAGPLIAVLAFACATHTVAQDTAPDSAQDAAPNNAHNTCTPALAIGGVHFTEMQPPTLARTWSAVVSVDASHCPANATGTFDIVFVREKETAPDLTFRERFVWRAPSVKVQLDFAADESVQSYRIDNVTSCVCGG